MDIREKQPHIVVTLPDAVHVIAIPDLRSLANGCKWRGDKDMIIQVLARALVDNVN